MQDGVKQTFESKAMLAGVFSGIAALLVSLVFNYVYRYLVNYTLTEVFNIVFMTIGILLSSLVLGIIYGSLYKNIKGLFYFRIIIVIASIICIVTGLTTHRGHDADTAVHFKILLSGVVIITACFNTIGIPYLTKHKTGLF